MKNKLTKQQVLAIPKLLETKSVSVKEIAVKYQVGLATIWYWIRKLRDKGIECKTRKKGRMGLLD